MFVVKTVLVFLLLMGFAFLLSWLSKMPSIQIENIEVSGNSTISKDEIIGLIRKETSAKYFKLFSKNSVFLYPKESIEAKLEDNFKKIETVSIKSKGLKTIIVSMVERKPDSLWCFSGSENGTIRKNNNSGKCYFLDKEGVVFSEAPDFSGSAFLRYYGLLDGADNPIGQNYLFGGKFKEVSEFINSLEVLEMRVASFRAESGSDYEIILKNGIKIILDDKQPFDKTLENIQSILGEIDLKKDYSTGSPSKINYVDLRFGNKVYLKGE